MPSGLNQILPRVRVSSDALRVSVLVVAGVTTGYFWRAAFEASVGGPPAAPINLVIPNPKPPLRIIVPAKPTPARHAATRPSRLAVSRLPQTVRRTAVPI